MTPNGNTKMRKGIGRLVNRPTKTGGRMYDKYYVYIPTHVAKDTAFPFKEGDRVTVEIKGRKLIIEKA